MRWVERVRGVPGRKLVVSGLALLAVLSSGAAAQDLGYEGPGFHGAGSAPTESKPESKLWFHDDAWWGSLWSTSAQAFRIHRLDQRTHVWTDTGVAVEFRSASKSDALVDGDRLYIASHKGSSDGGVSGNPILLLRYSYDTFQGSYSLDAGFPVTIGNFSTESLVIDKDSTGTVWAAWVQDRRVNTCHSVGGKDLIWSAPAILPGSDSDFTYDEVCALTRFGGNQIGVMWSDQVLNLFRFAVHQDGAADDVWSLETPLSGESDDHIHLAAESTGRVFATVKNAAEEIKLLVRDAGVWSAYPVSTGIDRFTRPIVLLDEEQRLVHVFASGQDNGLIHAKTSSLDTIAFAPGTGEVVIRDASDPLVNNATSTKQNVDSSTGLVVLAAHESSEMYWHHSVPPAGLLVAAFTGTPHSGVAPLQVQFTDASTGTPTSWSWDFGDGGASSAQNPAHTYTQSGTFAVRLTVQNAGGSDEELWNGLVTVAPAQPTQTFAPVADSRVNEAAPGSNAGTNAELRIRSSPGSSYETYLRFDLSGLSGPVASAKLRLFCTDGSTVGGLVFPTTNAWNETTITWNNRPAATGSQITALGSITSNTWVEYDVTAGIAGPGLVSFLLRSTSTNSAYFTSRESTSPPQLVVALTEIVPTVAEFTASTTSGTAPLSVDFTDLSSGNPTSWSWDFGDGTGSTLRNPVHVYTSAGSYTVALTASGGGGTSTESKFEFVYVTPPAAPVAAFTATPTSGSAPLSVAFTDTTSGSVNAWLWDFGDGATSSVRHPVHVYANAGTYSVALTATGPGGSDVESQTDLVSVSAPPPIQTLLPVADSRVNEAAPGSNAGTNTELRIRSSPGGSYETYLRFDLSGLSGPVASAKLRLFCTDGSTVGGLVFPTTNAWNETTITWNNRPAATGSQITALGSITTNTWVEYDVTAGIAGPGLVSFLLRSTSTNSAYFTSREGTSPPQLVVVLTEIVPTVAEFTASTTSGTAPLSVDFTDLSSGNPTSWSWDFGDGTGSTLRNPVHVYTSAGSYTVALTASGAGGTSTESKFEFVHVTPLAAPVAAFTATPTSGSAPLSVAFTDTTSGSVSAWLWDFGDGATSSVRHPVHVYANAGTYSVALTATGPGGSDVESQTDLVTVSGLPPIQTLLPVADSRVNEASPAQNAGPATLLRVRFEPGASYQTYLRFDLSSLGGAVLSAKLRLFCTDASNVGGLVFPTSNAWAENTLNWSNRPAASGAQIGSFGAVATGVWVEVDVTSAVSGSGLVSFLMTSTSTNSATYSSREGTNPPQLVVQTGAPLAPVADFSAAPTAGVAPISVAFTDLSSNGPTSWTWDFGDSAGSFARNPSHVYATAGTYTVTFTAANAAGNSVNQKVNLVTVSAPPPFQVLRPVADARVNEASPTTNSGRATELRVRAATGGSFQSYLRFDLSGLSAPPTSVKLRLYCTDASTVGGFLSPTTSAWTENTITWNNRPPASGPQIAALGPVTAGAWVEVDVTSAIGAPGLYSFLLSTSSSDSVLYHSREGTQPPELVVATGGP